MSDLDDAIQIIQRVTRTIANTNEVADYDRNAICSELELAVEKIKKAREKDEQSKADS